MKESFSMLSEVPKEIRDHLSVVFCYETPQAYFYMFAGKKKTGNLA